MQTEHIDVSVNDAIMTIRIQRPDKKNALTTAMYGAMKAAVEDAAQRDDVRVVLLQGTDDCFTAGNDLGDFQRRGQSDTNEESVALRFIGSLMALDKPVVAAVNGLAIGIGVTMLLHCDFVYVGESAALRTPFVDLGLCPEAASSLLLPLMVGARRAADILLAADTLSGSEAVACGLANAVFADSELMQRAREQALKLASKPPMAMRQSKRLLKRAWAEQVRQTIEVEGQVFGELLRSPEAQAIIGAFLAPKK